MLGHTGPETGVRLGCIATVSQL